MMKSNEILCEEIKNGNKNSLTQLLIQNEKLIYSLMKRFYYNPSDKEDIYSCAKIGLIKAAYNYDSSFNCLFSTYVVPIILGEIKKFFREVNALHISRSVKDLYRMIIKSQEELEAKFQRSVTLNDISEYLGISIDDILVAYESHAPLISLDSPLKEDDDVTLLDIIENKNNINLDLKLALENLNSREKLIIQLRYYEGLTQEEVAKRLFISQVQISRLEKKILAKIKQLI